MLSSRAKGIDAPIGGGMSSPASIGPPAAVHSIHHPPAAVPDVVADLLESDGGHIGIVR